jgi:hypothetical protein
MVFETVALSGPQKLWGLSNGAGLSRPVYGANRPEDLRPGMSAELIGIDDDITRIEEWQASFLAHEMDVEDRRGLPEIPVHPDWHRSTKQQKAFFRDMQRCAEIEDGSEIKIRMPRSTSAEA